MEEKTKRWKRNRNEKGKIYICLKSARDVQQNRSEQMFHPLIFEINAYKRSLPGKVPGETSLVLNLIKYSSWNTSRKIRLFNMYCIWLHNGFKLLHTVDNVTF